MQFIDSFDLIDLTHTLDETVPTWTGRCGFEKILKMDYPQGLRVFSYKCQGGIGTHIDVPAHFFPEGETAEQVALSNCLGPLCVLDVSKRCAPDLAITPDDVLAHEREYGPIEPGSFVCGYTGWEAFWQETARYRMCDKQGMMHFPTFHGSTAELLLARGIHGIGIDTLSPDPQGSAFPVHHAILGAGKLIIENVAHLAEVPKRGAYVQVFPLKIRGGVESPVRMVAFVKKN